MIEELSQPPYPILFEDSQNILFGDITILFLDVAYTSSNDTFSKV